VKKGGYITWCNTGNFLLILIEIVEKFFEISSIG
jgi:hypothetical protein